MNILRRIWTFLQSLLAPLTWVAEQLGRLFGGLFGPPWRALVRVMRRFVAWVESIVTRLLQWWERVWKTGKTERVKEARIGPKGAPLLATITLALLWYLLPTAAVLDYPAVKFVFAGFAIWIVALAFWISRTRADRVGVIARFAQSVHRTTGLRRLEQVGFAFSVVLLITSFRQIQLIPFAVGCVLAFGTVLTDEYRPRPAFALPVPPPFPVRPATDEDGGGDGTESDDEIEEIDPDDLVQQSLRWSVMAHGVSVPMSAVVPISRRALAAAREANTMFAEDVDRIVDWVVNGSDPSVDALAEQIHRQCFDGGLSLFATVSSYAAACQSIRYVSDLESTGHEEYWRFPIETIADGVGDCEDSAILLAALLRRSGIRSLILLAPGHAAVGVEVPNDVPGAYLEHEGIRYYYCETTTEGFMVGTLPADIDPSQISFIPVPDWQPE